MVGLPGVHTASVAARADQEAHKQDIAHAPVRTHMAAMHVEDILGREEDAGAKFLVERVRHIIIHY